MQIVPKENTPAPGAYNETRAAIKIQADLNSTNRKQVRFHVDDAFFDNFVLTYFLVYMYLFLFGVSRNREE